jgi:DNA sulfur modification protein DndE
MRRCLFLLLFFGYTTVAQQLPVIQSVSFPADTFNILKYGAVPNSLALNTDAINNAIAACNKKGGGVVVVPRGFWVTGPVRLASNVNLHLEKNAVVQFSDNLSLYPLIKTNWEGLDAYRCHSPLYGMNLENIAITGSGILDGAGQAWRPVKKSKLTPPEWNQLVASGGFINETKDTWYPTESSFNGSKVKRPGVIAEGYDLDKSIPIKDFLRPNMLSLVNCKRVLLEGVTFQNSPAWCLHPLLSSHLTLRNLTVRNPWNAQNGDGVDLESCKNVLIEGSSFDVGDDGICIKSGRDEEGRKRGVPTEDVIVRNCTVFHGHGGFVIGSEMSGGARNIFVYDCNFLGTDIGLRFKTTRGRGGIVEKIYVKNIGMNNIGGAAILFDMYYMAKDPLAIFGGEVNPEEVFQPVTEATPQFRDIHIDNVVCKGAETAIFIRGLPEMNVKNVSLENIAIESQKGIVCIEAEDILFKNVAVYSGGESVVNVQNSKNIVLDKIEYKASEILLNVAGARSKDIRLVNTDNKNAKKEIQLGEEVPAKAVQKK